MTLALSRAWEAVEQKKVFVLVPQHGESFEAVEQDDVLVVVHQHGEFS